LQTGLVHANVSLRLFDLSWVLVGSVWPSSASVGQSNGLRNQRTFATRGTSFSVRRGSGRGHVVEKRVATFLFEEQPHPRKITPFFALSNTVELACGL
jgi:hypothetical protein